MARHAAAPQVGIAEKVCIGQWRATPMWRHAVQQCAAAAGPEAHLVTDVLEHTLVVVFAPVASGLDLFRHFEFVLFNQDLQHANARVLDRLAQHGLRADSAVVCAQHNGG